MCLCYRASALGRVRASRDSTYMYNQDGTTDIRLMEHTKGDTARRKENYLLTGGKSPKYYQTWGHSLRMNHRHMHVDNNHDSYYTPRILDLNLMMIMDVHSLLHYGLFYYYMLKNQVLFYPITLKSPTL